MLFRSGAPVSGPARATVAKPAINAPSAPAAQLGKALATDAVKGAADAVGSLLNPAQAATGAADAVRNVLNPGQAAKGAADAVRNLLNPGQAVAGAADAIGQKAQEVASALRGAAIGKPTSDSGLNRLPDVSVNGKSVQNYESGPLPSVSTHGAPTQPATTPFNGGVTAQAQTQPGLSTSGSFNHSVEANAIKTENLHAGAYAGVSGQGSITADQNGLNAQGSVEARAGLSAGAEGSVSGKYGTASGSVEAKLEASAGANGSLTVDNNGLKAEGGVHAGAVAEVNAQGRLETPSTTIAGVPVNASLEAEGRAFAGAEAGATGRAQVTADPPTAIVEGEAGAFAGVKAEGSVTASAGPFSVTASGEASAGAGAEANAGIGFDGETGNLSVSFGASAAAGLGLGGGLEFNVNVKEVGQMATNTVKDAGQAVVNAADVNNDGKVGMDDAKAAVTDTAKTVAGWLGF